MHEQRNPLTLLQTQDSETGLQQLIDTDLQQLVTRQRLEVVAPLLVIFALGAAVLALRPAHLRALIPGAKSNETVKGGT